MLFLLGFCLLPLQVWCRGYLFDRVPGGSIDAQVSSVEVGQLSQLTLTSLNLDFHALVMDLRSILPSLKVSASLGLEICAIFTLKSFLKKFLIKKIWKTENFVDNQFRP